MVILAVTNGRLSSKDFNHRLFMFSNFFGVLTKLTSTPFDFKNSTPP